MADFPNLHLNLITRTRHLTAETRDLKIYPQPIIRSPVSLCCFNPTPTPTPTPTPIHLIFFTNVSCGACLLVFQPPGSAV